MAKSQLLIGGDITYKAYCTAGETGEIANELVSTEDYGSIQYASITAPSSDIANYITVQLTDDGYDSLSIFAEKTSTGGEGLSGTWTLRAYNCEDAYLDIEITSGGGEGGGGSTGTTIYDISISESPITFQPDDDGDTETITFTVLESTNGGSTYDQSWATPQEAGVSASLDDENDNYIKILSTNFSEQGRGSVTIQYYNTYRNTEDDHTGVGLNVAVSTGDSYYIPITILHNYNVYRVRITSYPSTTQDYNKTLTSSDFTVKYQTKLVTDSDSNWSDVNDVTSSCSFSPDLSNTPYPGETKSFIATYNDRSSEAVNITWGSAPISNYTISVPSAAQNLDLYWEDLSLAESIPITTDPTFEWSIISSSDYALWNVYLSAVRSGDNLVISQGDSRYQGTDYSGSVTIGDSNKATTTLYVTLHEGSRNQQSHTYAYTLEDMYLDDDDDGTTSSPSTTKYLDGQIDSGVGFNFVITSTSWYDGQYPSDGNDIISDYVDISGGSTINVSKTSYHFNLSSTPCVILVETKGEIPGVTPSPEDSFKIYLTHNTTPPVIEPIYQWVYVSASFDNYTYEVPWGTDSHTVNNKLTGSYTIKQQVSNDSGSTWTDVTGSTEDISFSNGSLDTSFTQYRSSGDYSGSKPASVTVQNSSVGSSNTFNGNVSISITFEPEPDIPKDYEYKLEASIDTNYHDTTVSPGETLAKTSFHVYWYKREVGTSSWGNSIEDVWSTASYSSLTVPSNAENGDTFDVNITDNSYSPIASGYSNSDTVSFTVYVPPLEYNLVCTNPSSSSITLPYGSSVSKSDFTFKLTYGGSDVETGISGDSNSLSWNGNGPSLPWTNNYSYSGSHNYSVTYNTYSASTTVTIFFEPEDIQQDTYSLECTTNPYNSSINGLANGSSLDKSGFRFTLKKNGSVEQNNIAGTSNVLSWNPSSWTNNESSAGTKSFTVTHTSHNEASTSVTIYYKAPVPPASSTVTFDDETGTIPAGSTKYFYVSFTPKGSNSGSGVNYSLSSTAYATINSSWEGLTTGRGYAIIKNNSRTIQERTVTLTATHKLNNSVSDTVVITLLPPSFVVEFEYWYNAPCAYGEIASGELTVRGAIGESFTLTITNNSTSNGFTYGFRNGNSYSTTYSGTIGSSGYTKVDVYEYTKGENAEDSYSTSKITGVGGNSSRTDYCMIARRKISASMSMNANPYSFPYTGGNCTFSLSSSGFDDPSFELIEYSDGAAMIENSASYIGRITDYPGTFSVRITENTAVTSRRVTVRFRVRGTEYGDDYEKEFVKEVTLTQAGRAPEQVIIVNPSSLTFTPTAHGASVAQIVTISSGDYEWNIVGNLPDWLAIVNNKTSGVSGDTISIYPTSQSGVNTRSAAITFQATGGTITGSLTILQTENDRLLGFGHADDSVSKGWDIADEDFTGLSKYNDEHGWSYNASTRTLTINIPAESPKTLGTSQTETVNALYKVISRFIGWDMKVEGEAPTWLRVSPTSKFYDPTKTNAESTNINVVADDYNFQIDSSCYDQPRTAKYIINSNLKKNQ